MQKARKAYIEDEAVVVVVVVVTAPAEALSAMSDMAPPLSAGAISEVVVSVVVVVSLDFEQALAPWHRAGAASGSSSGRTNAESRRAKRGLVMRREDSGKGNAARNAAKVSG